MYEHALDAKVTDAAQAVIDNGLWTLMLANTWRSVIQQYVGPIIGFNWNITVPGIVATCLRLNVPVEFEAE
jgi:ABC-type polysaccharide/polyol phosphate export permease